MWGESGTAQFDALELPDAFDHRLAVLRDLVHSYDEEIDSARPDHPLDVQRRCRLPTPSRPSTGWARCSPPSSWPRSATCTASTPPRHCAPGPGSPRSTGSPTARSIGDASPSRDLVWCGGRPSRRWPATTGVKRSRRHFHAIAERRGKTRANVAIARKVLTLVYYGTPRRRDPLSPRAQGGVTLGHTGRELG